MKKGLIAITVILFVLILALRYVEEKSGRSDDKKGAKIQTEKGVEGVALPEGREENLPTGDLDVESYDSGLVSYGDPITLSEGEEGLSKACAKGSVKDIFIAHGKIWGYSIADSKSFNEKESRALYDHLAQYTACRSAALRNVSYCNKLPAGMKGVRNIPSRISSQSQCVDITNNIIFSDFMAGNSKYASSCQLLLSGDAFKNMPIPSEIFCKAAAGGLENMCESFKKQGIKGNAETLKECQKNFPRNLSDCSSEHCKTMYKIYEAIKNKKAEICPDGYKEACRAYLSKSVKPCDSLAMELSKTYCNFLKRVNKVSGNYPGMTAEEIKQLSEQMEMEAAEERKRKEEEKIEEEKRKKESEKVTKEINERVRKLMGKE